MVSTVGDYLRFAEMLLHGGATGSTRLLSPSTVSLMTSDALLPGIGYSERARTVMADLAPTPSCGIRWALSQSTIVKVAPFLRNLRSSCELKGSCHTQHRLRS
jgi:hypothetical protein